MFAQKDTLTKKDALVKKDTVIKSSWNMSSVEGINASQVALSNWAQGGANSIAWTFSGTFVADLKKDTVVIFKNNLKLTYGQTKLGSADFRTNENELFVENKYSYNLNWKVNPFLSNSLRTVIANGYDYTKTPKAATSKFFDPGYLTQSLGFEFNREKVFSIRIGVALQEVFTNRFTSYTDDATTTKVEKFKLDSGIESVMGGCWPIEENMDVDSKLRLFSRFKTLDVWDVRWENTLTAKINKLFNANINVIVVYEKDQSDRTQMKQALQLGITYALI